MGGVERDVCSELLGEVIAENGDIVCVVKAAAGRGEPRRIYLFKERYWGLGGGQGLEGPFGSLEEALTAGFLTVTPDTESIFCSELDGDGLLARLRPKDLPGPLTLKVNGELMTLAPDGSVQKSA
jgi:hypothetical protein